MSTRKILRTLASLTLVVAMLSSGFGASATEIRGIPEAIIKKILSAYPEGTKIVSDNAIAVYFDPYNDMVAYEVPLYNNNVLQGSFSVDAESNLKSETQSIHLVDFEKMKNIDKVIAEINKREGATVKDYRYVFMRDLYTSNILYMLDNGNTGVYVMTSRIMKEDVCLSVVDWEYQVEYSAEHQWEEKDLRYQNSSMGTGEVILIILLVILLIVIVYVLTSGKDTEKTK